MRFGKERAKDWDLMDSVHHWKRLCLTGLEGLVHHWKGLHLTGLKGVKGAISFERVFMLYVFDPGSVGLWRIWNMRKRFRKL